MSPGYNTQLSNDTAAVTIGVTHVVALSIVFCESCIGGKA
jgi:hypothetical protein